MEKIERCIECDDETGKVTSKSDNPHYCPQHGFTGAVTADGSVLTAREDCPFCRAETAEAALAESEAELESVNANRKKWVAQFIPAEMYHENDHDEHGEALERWRKKWNAAEAALREAQSVGAAGFADLLMQPKWRDRINTDGIDCPGLLTDALDAAKGRK